MDASWLPDFWAGLIGLAIFVYVVLDGYDLGVGILTGFTKNKAFRNTMMESIAPFWDGNEVWLVLIGAGLFGAFPAVYAIFLPAFYLPVALMLMGLIFRGVAFEFRYRAGRSQWVWDRGFFLGSLVVSLVQGAAMGGMVQGLTVVGGRYAGGTWDWLTLPTLFTGIGLAVGYALLGAAWLVLKTEGDVRDWAYSKLTRLVAGVLVVLALVSAYALTSHPFVRERWLVHPWLVIFPAIVLLAAMRLWAGARRRRDRVPYPMAVIIFLGALMALAGSFWPYAVPFTLTIQDAAAPVQTLRFLFYGAGIVVFPIVLIYTGMVYWILRGKVRENGT